jgi:hypothetical protein
MAPCADLTGHLSPPPSLIFELLAPPDAAESAEDREDSGEEGEEPPAIVSGLILRTSSATRDAPPLAACAPRSTPAEHGEELAPVVAPSRCPPGYLR